MLRHTERDMRVRKKQFALLLTSQLCMQARVRSKSLWENSVSLQWTPHKRSWPAINSGDLKKSCLRQLAYTLGKVDQFQMPVLLHLGRVYFKWAFRKWSCFYFVVDPSRLLLLRCCQQMHFHPSSLRGETLLAVGGANGRQGIDPNLCSVQTRNGVNWKWHCEWGHTELDSSLKIIGSY